MTTTLPAEVRVAHAELTELLVAADPGGAARVRQVEQGRSPVPTVVVLGETNRGKSSLVNALLATPELSPVDAATATSTYLVIQHGSEWAARACFADDRPAVPIAVRDLGSWVSADGELPDGVPPPRFVEVAAPVPLLESLSLVDTPGVGGLHGVHRERAAERLPTPRRCSWWSTPAARSPAGSWSFCTSLRSGSRR